MGEKLTVVNENDEIIGAEDRKKVHDSNFWHRGTHVFIFNDKGELLVQLRSPDKDKYPSRYDCSVSGHVDFGKDYKETAKREIKEELGIDIDKLDFLAHFRMVYGENDFMVCKLFKCEYNGELNSNEEISELRYIDTENLKKILEEKSETLTPWFVEILKWYFKMDNKLIIF